MLTLSLALLALFLSDSTKNSTATSAPTVLVASLPCPVRSWIGPCTYMTDAQKKRIRRALASYATVERPNCRAARVALLQWLEYGQQAWVFDTHVEDDVVPGVYIFGQTAHFAGTKRPAGFGLRADAFGASGPELLARVALHEGAHLAGADEAGATAVEKHCVVP